MRGKKTLRSVLATIAVSGSLLLGALPASSAPATTQDAEPFIVGGGFVTTAKPWISALHRNGGFTCTSSIIAARWVLTAAHCVEAAGSYSVRVGSLTRSSGGQTANATRVIKHPSYRWPNADIALVELDRSISTTYSVLATTADIATNQAATAYGWGSEKADWSGPLPERLKYADGRVSDANCNSATPRVLCTQTNGSIAGGDSGGPVYVRSPRTGQMIQGGVCAIGHKPAGSGWAGYTNVALFRDWIRSYAGV